MCNILYFHSSNELYGADRSLLRTVKLLNRELYKTHVILPSDLPYDGLLSHELKQANIDYVEMYLAVLRRQYLNPLGLSKLLFWNIKSTFKASRLAKDRKIDLIHSNTTAVLTGGTLSRFARIPHIWHVREIITEPKWFKFLMALIINLFCDEAIAVSEAVKSNLIQTLPALANKISVINNGIDITPFSEKKSKHTFKRSLNIPEQAIVVGMVGRINAWKGQNFLLQAASQVMRNNPNIYLVFTGGSIPGETFYNTQFSEAINNTGLRERIRIQDFQKSIVETLSGFDIFVLPSIRPDPFPTVVLEAMASGLPVVATAHGGAMEQVVPGQTGFLVSPEKPEELERVLSRLVDDTDLRIRMGLSARERVLTNFTVEKYIQKLSLLYEKILAK